ncbi:MAG: regulatory protein GemA [Pseudohongiellaceae bacterium]|nr:regulatory protein GemA [Pseudohongiellaceae bacterium]
MANPRKDIAVIKIAIKDLQISDEDGNSQRGVLSTYRQMLKNLTGKTSIAVNVMSDAERAKVIRHLKRRGFKNSRRSRSSKAAGMATSGQLGLISSLWIQLDDAGALKSCTYASLNAWLESNTKRFNRGAGYSSTQFLPQEAAIEVIESLKQWLKRETKKGKDTQ